MKIKTLKSEKDSDPLSRLVCDFCGTTDRSAHVIFRNTLNRAGICCHCVELFMLKLLELDSKSGTKIPAMTRH